MEVGIRRTGLITLLVAVAAAVGGAGGAAAARAPSATIAGPEGAERATVTFSITRLGNGTITSTPAGILCGPGPTETQCSAEFAPGTQVTLRAQPIIGWAWHYWDGICVGRTTPTCAFSLTAPASALVIFVGVDNVQAEFQPTWSNSLLSGSVAVSGTASHEAAMELSLIRSGRTIASATQAVPAPGGNFTGSIALRRLRVLPGPYIVKVAGTVSGRRIPGREVTIRLPVPREGLVARAWVTPLGSPRAVTRLPGGAVGAEAHFQFSYRPAPGTRVLATWFQGRIRLGSAAKARSRIVKSKVLRPGGLPRGFFYRCVLTVNGVVVKETGVRTR